MTAPDRRVTEDTAILGVNIAAGDLVDLVDVSDTTDAATGTNKKATTTEFFKTPVPRIAEVTGNRIGGVTSGSGGTYGLEVPVSFTNPNATIQQAFSSYAFYSGTPGGSSGSLEGGSSEVYVFNNGSGNINPQIVGFETITHVDGDNGARITTASSHLVTIAILGSQGATNLIGQYIPAVHRSAGSGTVTNAYATKIEEPTVGTNKFSAYIAGRTRLVKGVANVLEIANASDLLQWSSDGSTITGYASDGASARLIFDPQDGATARITSSLFGSNNHFVANDNGSPVFTIAHAGGFGAFGTTPPAAKSATGSTLSDAFACLRAFGMMV